ncbi:TIGR03118 family protein [Chitinophaga varians]|uniref:TIGR03118 family protein n=1 Tax=Chitinophaga varians TaxID=2202339 RepID=UPI00165FFD30|nr:TIGR03118 family protein [Chitinophaga varians]MBC9914787.1 TIGR03118 family protein [Chitinophaga varians]
MITPTRKLLAAGLAAGIYRRNVYSGIMVMLVTLLMLVTSCRRWTPDECTDCDCLSKDYKQTNLVADTAGFGAARIDPLLVNAWGLAVGPTGAFWISTNGNAKLSPIYRYSVVYDKDGNMLRAPVVLPVVEFNPNRPTGVVFNNTSRFGGSRFIFADEAGLLISWTSGDTAVDQPARYLFNAVYKGLAIASDSGKPYIYATNFHDGTIDVFDTAFKYIPYKQFTDPNIPAGFAPFNIRNIDGLLYVTYAKQKLPDKKVDEAGPGNGYVNVFRPDGSLVRRLASQGTLNSPWGITQGCSGLGKGDDDVVLIGNAGDGHINAYRESGTFLGQLRNGNDPLKIDGLWALESRVPGAGSKIFFTAGPGNGSHGLFGYLQKNELLQK